MSKDKKENVKIAQEAKVNQSTHYEKARAYFKQGIDKGAVKYGEISQNSTPHTSMDAAGKIGQAVWSGKNELGKSAKHAGMGFMEAVSEQNPNSGQQLNKMKINQAIADGSKANQATVNKGIEAAREKSSEKAITTTPSTNKGIASYQSKVSGKLSESSSGVQSKGNGQER